MHNSDYAEYLYIKAWYELHAKKGMIVTPFGLSSSHSTLELLKSAGNIVV